MIRLTKTIQISTYHLADLFAKPNARKESICQTFPLCGISTYRIAGGKVWRIDSFQAFGERKFGELIDQSIDYLAI